MQKDSFEVKVDQRKRKSIESLPPNQDGGDNRDKVYSKITLVQECKSYTKWRHPRDLHNGRAKHVLFVVITLHGIIPTICI